MEPLSISKRCMVQPEASHLHGNQPRRDQFARLGCDFDQIHQGQIAAEEFVTGNSFVVGEKVSAAVKNDPFTINFDGLHVM